MKLLQKYLLLLLTTLVFSVPSLAEKNDFFGVGVEVVNTAGKVGDDLLNSFFNQKWTRQNIQNSNWVDYVTESGIPSLDEIAQLESLGGKLKTRMIGLENSPINGTPFPGIDAVIDGGNALSLKTAVPGKEGIRLREMIDKANKLNGGNIAGHESWAGMLKNKVDGMLTASQSTKSYIKQRWELALSDPNVNSEIIDNLYIQASDGWLKWSSKTKSWIDF